MSDAVNDGLATAGGTVIGILVSLFTDATIGAIVLGVLSIGFIYYSTSMADKISKNLARGLGGTLTFFALYNAYIALLFLVIPDSIGLIFGIITLGTWNIILALILATVTDGLVVSWLTENLEQTGKIK